MAGMSGESAWCRLARRNMRAQSINLSLPFGMAIYGDCLLLRIVLQPYICKDDNHENDG
jgi:hypothetical protein